MRSFGNIYRQLHVTGLILSGRSFTAVPRCSLPHLQCYVRSSSATTAKGPQLRQSYSEKKEAEATQKLKLLNDVELEKFEELKMQFEDIRNTSIKVPTHMTNVMWVELLECKFSSSKKKLLAFWMKKEFVKKSEQVAKEQKVQARLQRNKDSPYLMNKGVLRGTYNYALMARVTQNKEKAYANTLMHGHPIVFDMSFEGYDRRYKINVMKQLEVCVSENLKHPEPFCMYATGIQKNGFYAERFTITVGDGRRSTIDQNDIKMRLHHESFTDLFSVDQLIYLTPDSQNILRYNPNDIYVIGAINDQADTSPVTLMQAKSMGIRHAKLPLHIVPWYGKKAISLNQIQAMLLDVQLSRRWSTAIKENMPKRLSVPFNDRRSESFFD